MRCPLCEVSMKEVSRKGVQVDVCPECRGVWLDRGELDKLLNLEGETQPTQDHHNHHRRTHDGDHQYPKHKKKKSWLGELLDFD